MSQGMQVWSASNALLLDVSSRLCRLHAVVTVSYPQGTMNGSIPVYASGFYSVPEMQDNGNWFVFSLTTTGVFGFQRMWTRIAAGGFHWQVFDVELVATGGGDFVNAAGSEQVTIMRLA